MTNAQHDKLKIAIVGGGLCGLVCAIALQQAGIDVDVFEAAAKFGEIGAGVGIGANAARVLQRIGVLDEVIKLSGESGLNMKMFSFISGMPGHEVLYDYPLNDDDNGIGAYRPVLLDALIKFIDPKSAHFHKRCVSVEPSTIDPARSTIQFTDGTSYDADVVIGADGIKSAVRTAVVAGDKLPVFSNTVCYRGLIPIEKVRAAGVMRTFTGRPEIFAGNGAHLVVFAVQNGTAVNVVAFAADNTIPLGSISLAPGEPWVKTVSQEEMLAVYDGWGDDVINLLKCIPTPSKWSIHVVQPALESYVKGRVALIGDAAHGMLPHLGAGAGQGLEDAYILAQLLSHPQTNQSNVENVLRVYDKIRHPRAQMVWDGSVKAGRIYDGFGEHGLSREGIQQDVGHMWDEVLHYNIQDDMQTAIGWLKDESVFV